MRDGDKSDRELLLEVHGNLKTHLAFCAEHCRAEGEVQETIAKRLDAHHNTLYGNGRTGMTFKVHALWGAGIVAVAIMATVIGGILISRAGG